MASISKRTTASDERRYDVHWRDPDGDRQKKTFRRSRDADRFRAEIEHRMFVGTYANPADGKTSIAEFYADWAARQVWRPRTEHNHERTQAIIRDRLGAIPLASLRRSHVEAWVKAALIDYAPSSVQLHLKNVRQVLGAAIEDGAITRDASKGIEVAAIRPPVIIPTIDKVEAIVTAHPRRWFATALLIATSGLRPGEALAMTVENIDFLRRVVHVRQQVKAGPNEPLGVYPLPKTSKSFRTIPVPEATIMALSEHIATHLDEPSGLLLIRADGLPERPAYHWGVFKSAARAAEVGGTWTLRDLRHFYASMLIAGGESIKTVQNRLGHASAKTTLDTYAHLWPDNDEVTRRVVSPIADRLLVSHGCPIEPKIQVR